MLTERTLSITPATAAMRTGEGKRVGTKNENKEGNLKQTIKQQRRF
jgi:hypothetical protein